MCPMLVDAGPSFSQVANDGGSWDRDELRRRDRHETRERVVHQPLGGGPCRHGHRGLGARRTQGAGIRVGKVQVSAGLRVRMDPGDRALVDALRPFAEGVYLHQVVERRDGRLVRYLDLPEALEAAARDGGGARELADSLPRPPLPRGAGPVREHAGLPPRGARPPPARGPHGAPRGGDVHVGRAPRSLPTEDIAAAVARELRWVLDHRLRGQALTLTSKRTSASAPRLLGSQSQGLTPYLILGRVSNLPTVWTNTLAWRGARRRRRGTRPPGPARARLLPPRTGGMCLNDAFDREIDARERPERPFPAGAFRRAGSSRPASPFSGRGSCSWPLARPGRRLRRPAPCWPS